MKKIKESPVLITIVTLLVIVIIYCIFMFIKINIERLQGNMQVSTNIVDEKYHSVSYFLENNSKDKIEKVVADIDISSDDMQSIYEEKEKENMNYESYIIWFFSSEEKSQGASTYELGLATRENGKIKIVNIKEEQEEEELAKQKEEALKEQERKEEEEKEKAKQEEEEFKKSCENVSYENLARNPDEIEGKKVKITGEVIQALYSYGSVDLRVNITEWGTYSTYYKDTIYVTYYPEDGEDKILEDDIITIWGTAQGDYSYTSTIGSMVTLPLVFAKYIEINE